MTTSRQLILFTRNMEKRFNEIHVEIRKLNFGEASRLAEGARLQTQDMLDNIEKTINKIGSIK